MKRFFMVLLLCLFWATCLQAAQTPIKTGGGVVDSVDKIALNKDIATLYASFAAFPVTLCYTVGDETTDLTAAADKKTVRAPWAFTFTGILASVSTAPTGAAILVDVNDGGTTVISTKVMIDVTESTSTTATTPYVISDSAIAADAEITIDIDQIGSSAAGKGLKVCLIGNRPI